MNWHQVWDEATGPLFALVLGMMYLAGKIAVRHFIHTLAAYKYDVWAMIAWLGVDLAVLSWSVAIGGEIDARLALNRPQTVVFFLCLAGCTMLAGASYGLFINRRKIVGQVPAVKDFRLFCWLTLSWFFGLLQFAPIVQGLLRTVPKRVP